MQIIMLLNAFNGYMSGKHDKVRVSLYLQSLPFPISRAQQTAASLSCKLQKSGCPNTGG